MIRSPEDLSIKWPLQAQNVSRKGKDLRGHSQLLRGSKYIFSVPTGPHFVPSRNLRGRGYP